jgi:hypothetical protein
MVIAEKRRGSIEKGGSGGGQEGWGGWLNR